MILFIHRCGIRYDYLIFMGFTLGMGVVGLISVVLWNFVTINIYLAIFISSISIFITFILKKNRKFKIGIRLEIDSLLNIIHIMTLSFIILRSYLFFNGRDFVDYNYSTVRFYLSLISSYAYGSNTRNPHYYNMIWSSSISSNDILVTYSSLLVVSGASLRTGLFLTVYLQLCSLLISIKYLYEFFSTNYFGGMLCIILVLFSTSKYSIIDTLSLNQIVSLPFLIFGITFLYNGIFKMFRKKNDFIIASIFFSLAFTVYPIHIYSVLVHSFTIMIFSFPYLYSEKWGIVIEKWLSFFSLMVFFNLPQMFYTQNINDYSLVLCRPNFSSIIGYSPYILILFFFHSWIGLYSKGQFLVQISFMFSFFLSLCFYTPQTSCIQAYIYCSYPFLVISATNFLVWCLSSNHRILIVFSIILSSSLVLFGTVASANHIRINRNSTVTHSEDSLSGWVIQNTRKNSLFFCYERSFDPLINYAGRQTIYESDMHVVKAIGYLPSMYIQFYSIYRFLNSYEFISNYAIDYLLFTNKTAKERFLPEMAHFWILLLEFENFSLYRKVPDNIAK